ncbi:MAG: hypothetical protein U0939_09260 [Pirellulales bacterium]
MHVPHYDSLHTRGRALEEAYFHDRDQQLIDELKRRFTAEEAEKMLEKAIGIADELAVKAVTQTEAGVQVLTAMALLPLAEVAWCDGEVTVEEHHAILRAASEYQIDSESVMYKLLQSWLKQRPSPESLAAWKNYVKALCATLEPQTIAKMKEGVVGRAEKIARAAGGFLGFGSKISVQEQECLDCLAECFCK